MIQLDRTVGRELPIRAVTLHLITSNLKDLSGIHRNIVREGSSCHLKSNHLVLKVTMLMFAHSVPEDQSWDAFTSRAWEWLMQNNTWPKGHITLALKETQNITVFVTPGESPKGVWGVLDVHQPSPESCYPLVGGEVNIQFDSAACLVFTSWSLLRAKASQEGSTCLPAF